jgi:hypothetical protein
MLLVYLDMPIFANLVSEFVGCMHIENRQETDPLRRRRNIEAVMKS